MVIMRESLGFLGDGLEKKQEKIEVKFCCLNDELKKKQDEVDAMRKVIGEYEKRYRVVDE
ncbi:hypothetical protein Hanom_Chr03g00263821 [Helianthus anomalus]